MKNLLKNNLVKLTAILITWSLLCVGISQAYTVMGRDEGGTGINPEDFLVGDMIFISQDDAYAFQRLSAQGQNETVLQTVAGIPTWQYLSRIRALKEFGDTNATTTALGPFEANMLAIFNDDVAMYNLLTVNRFLATSTTATSTVDGYFDIGKGLEVGANKGFWVHESAPVNSLIVMDSGFVGVATNTPYRALSVLGDGAISGNLNIAALTATSSLTVSSATATSTLPQLDVTDIDGTRADFDFLTINTSATIPTLTVTYASTTALTVDEGAWLAVNSGNVGVGTTSPWKKFSVLGDGIFTSDLSVANLTATGTASVTGTLTVDSTSTSTIPELLTTSLVAGGYLEIPYFNATGTATSTILALEGTDIGATRMDTDFLTVNTSGVIPTLTGTSLTYTNASTTYTSATNYSASGYFESESTTATNTMPQLDVTDIDGTRGDFDYLTINTSATIPSLTITNATSTYATTTDLYVSNWMNIASGKDYLINGTSVLNATTLGGAVVNSSLTSLGTITNLIATYASTTGLDLAGYLVTPLATSTSATTTDLYVSNWLNLASGKDYLINGTSVLNATTLGGAVVNSSLTSLGTIANLTATYASTTNLTSDKDAWFAVTSGNVGIGTTSPLSMLSVRSSGTTDLLNLVETGGVEVFTVLENGNVGIGTTSPGALLDVNSSTGNFRISGKDVNWYSTQTAVGNDPVRINSYRSREGGAVVDNDNLFWHLVYGHDGTDYNTIGGAIKFVVDGTVATDKMPTEILFQTAEGASASDLSTKMIITPAGNVGIGITDPGTKLHVAGDVQVGELSAAAAQSNFIAQGNTAGSIEEGVTWLTGMKIASDVSNNGIVSFYTSNAGAIGTEKVTILGSGNVGIGTTSPTEQLSVDNQMYIGSNGGTATSTIEGNLDVLGTLHATVSYTGDLYFSNNFRFTECEKLGKDYKCVALLDDESNILQEWTKDGVITSDNSALVEQVAQLEERIKRLEKRQNIFEKIIEWIKGN